MKRTLAALVLCSAITVPAAAQTAVQKTLTPRVEQVKVYSQGAYVNATAQGDVAAGPQTFVIDGVQYLQENTLQVKITPQVAYSVSEVERPRSVQELAEYKRLTASRDSVQSLWVTANNKLEIILQKTEFLKSNYSVKGDNANLSVETLRSVSAYIDTEMTRYYGDRFKLGQEMARYKQETDDLNTKIGQLSVNNTSRILIHVENPRAQHVRFELSYYTSAASWNPVYFFKFDQAKNGAQLEYLANVGQWTGSNWNGVKTQLSLNQPSLSLTLPVLNTQYARWYQDEPRDKSLSRKSYAAAEMTAVDAAKFGRTYADSEETPAVLNNRVNVTDVEINYELIQPVNIADSKRSSVTIPVKSENITALYTYQVAPRINGDVMLVARIPDWQKLNLTNGRMNVLFNGQMLAQSYLSVAQVGDTLSIPLGVDPSIIVKRERIGEYTEKASGQKMEQTFNFQITVKNNKSFAATVEVKENYPLSSSGDIEVQLLDISGAVADAKTGILTWELPLRPGEERKLTVRYTVRYPKNGQLSVY